MTTGCGQGWARLEVAVGFWFLIVILILLLILIFPPTCYSWRWAIKIMIMIQKPEDLTAAFNHTRKWSRGALDSCGLLILLSRRNPERSRI